jgi:hypothetical protein
MTYIRVKWNHSNSKYPVWLFSELDDKRWEVRKVEIFLDGTYGYADANEKTQSTKLGLEPVPSISTIASKVEFEAIEITKGEFEKVWSSRKQNGH